MFKFLMAWLFGSRTCIWCGATDPHGKPDWGPRTEDNKNRCRKCGRATP